jgi:hypothetical protein
VVMLGWAAEVWRGQVARLATFQFAEHCSGHPRGAVWQGGIRQRGADVTVSAMAHGHGLMRVSLCERCANQQQGAAADHEASDDASHGGCVRRGAVL